MKKVSDQPWESLFPTFSGHDEFRDRLKNLRLLRHWDQATLASHAGISATLVSQIERGRISPSVEQVGSLASALGCSSEYLVAELGLLPTTRPWLRAYADASRREASARTAFATITAEFIRRLELKPLPDLLSRFDGNLEDDDAIEEAADELRLLANIESDAVVSNAIRAAERLGCVVLPLDSELGRHFGMSVRSDQLPIVCVAKGGVPGDRQRFTVAHELGHLVLHGDVPPPRSAEEAARMERHANRFAAAFLGPGDALVQTLQDVGGRVTLRSLTDIKAQWGISIKGLVNRFHSLGVIDADHARSLYKQISARRWSKNEPVEVPTETAQWLERSLLKKSGSKDLHATTQELAAAVGGNALDLEAAANWEAPFEAQIFSMNR